MMNIPPDQVAVMALHDYETLLHHWNEAHGSELAAPDPEIAMPLLDQINANPRLTH